MEGVDLNPGMSVGGLQALSFDQMAIGGANPSTIEPSRASSIT